MSLLLTDNVPSPASWVNPRGPSYFRGSKSFPLTFIYVTIKHLVYRDMSVFALEAIPCLYDRRGLSSPSSIYGIIDIACIIDIIIDITVGIIIMGRCNFCDAGPRPSKMNLTEDPQSAFSPLGYIEQQKKEL